VGVFVIRNTRSDLNYSAWCTSKTKKIGRRQTYPASRESLGSLVCFQIRSLSIKKKKESISTRLGTDVSAPWRPPAPSLPVPGFAREAALAARLILSGPARLFLARVGYPLGSDRSPPARASARLGSDRQEVARPQRSLSSGVRVPLAIGAGFLASRSTTDHLRGPAPCFGREQTWPRYCCALFVAPAFWLKKE
jgi:hypothetical protein